MKQNKQRSEPRYMCSSSSSEISVCYAKTYFVFSLTVFVYAPCTVHRGKFLVSLNLLGDTSVSDAVLPVLVSHDHRHECVHGSLIVCGGRTRGGITLLDLNIETA